MGTKICVSCNKEKSLDSYYKNNYSKDRLMYQCKTCWGNKCKEFRENNPEKFKNTNRNSYLKKREERIAKQKEYSIKNKEKVLDYAKQYRLRNPDNSRKQTMKRFGLGLEDFYVMIENQNNACSICNKIFFKYSDAHLDHNHSTNNPRALLCSSCNTSIGLVNENISTLKNMIEYLNLWNSKK